MRLLSNVWDNFESPKKEPFPTDFSLFLNALEFPRWDGTGIKPNPFNIALLGCFVFFLSWNDEVFVFLTDITWLCV